MDSGSSPPRKSPFAELHSNETAQRAQKRCRLSPPLRISSVVAHVNSTPSKSIPEADQVPFEHQKSANTLEAAQERLPRIKRESVERWAVIDVEYCLPSPPGSPSRSHSSLACSFDGNSEFELMNQNGAARGSTGRIAIVVSTAVGQGDSGGPSIGQHGRENDAAPVTTTSKSQAVDPTNSSTAFHAEDPQVAHPDSDFQLPEFPPKGARWPVECEAALIKFCAQDSAIRGWATGNTRGGIEEVVKRFCELTGTVYSSVYSKLCVWRDRYDTFNRLLTPAGRSTPTNLWKESSDWIQLATYKATDPNHFLRAWHDLLFLSMPEEVLPATPLPTHLSGSKITSSAPSLSLRHLLDSGSSASLEKHPTSSPAPTPTITSDKRFPRDVRSVSFKPEKKRSNKHTYKRSKLLPGEPDIDSIQQHERTIKQLEEEGRERERLLLEQGKLLQRAVQQAELQFQTSEEQQKSLDSLTNRLQDLIASVTRS